MALVDVNGLPVFETRLCTPRTGVWHADLLVANSVAIAGAATIDVNSGALLLKGTAAPSRSGVDNETARARIWAGAGGMSLSAKPNHYNGTSVRIVLGDLLAAAGETLAATADAGIIATGIDAFTVTANPIGALVSQLLAAAAPGASWRMLADGTLWVGRETWPDAGVDPKTYQVLDYNPETRLMMLAVDGPLMLVGTTFEGKRVSYAEATVGQEGDGVTMRVWFEDAAVADVSDVDRMRKAFAALAQSSVARTDKIDYGRHYPARVIAQSGGTVDVQPDQVGGKDLLPDMAGVPLLLGLPGASVDTTTNGRVTIGWLGGDPSKPYAIAFDADNIVDTLTLAVNLTLFLGQQAGAEPPPKGTSFLTELAKLLVQLGKYAVNIAPVADPSGSATPALTQALADFAVAAPGTLATKVKVS